MARKQVPAYQKKMCPVPDELEERILNSILWISLYSSALPCYKASRDMPSFNPTSLWEAKPHTLAKIEIVRRYLYLWFSILGTNPTNKRVVYIDGFAGPGRYANSE
jgi:hypothetical protein